MGKLSQGTDGLGSPVAHLKLVAQLQMGPERVWELPGITQQAGEEREARVARRPKRGLAVPRPSLPDPRCLRPTVPPGVSSDPLAPLGRNPAGWKEGVGSLGRPQNPQWSFCIPEQGGSAVLQKLGKLRPRGRILPGFPQLKEGVLLLTLEASGKALPPSLSMAIRSAPRPSGASWGRAV